MAVARHGLYSLFFAAAVAEPTSWQTQMEHPVVLATPSPFATPVPGMPAPPPQAFPGLLQSALQNVPEAPISSFGPPTEAPPMTLGDSSCATKSDVGFWQAGGGTRFSKDMNSCGHECWGEESCVSGCMARTEEYSKECSKCFGRLAACAKTNCMMACMMGNSPACTQCVDAYCTHPFEVCTGFSTDPDAAPGSLIQAAKRRLEGEVDEPFQWLSEKGTRTVIV